jgi:hypothetical protein
MPMASLTDDRLNTPLLRTVRWESEAHERLRKLGIWKRMVEEK